jgi:putative glutathione S-transferase
MAAACGLPSSNNGSGQGLKFSWEETNAGGRFVRTESKFRDQTLIAEPDRYHLYVSLACPWANRTLIVRHLKGLEDVITYDVVDWFLGPDGWRFNATLPACTPDRVHGFQLLREVYQQSQPGYTGKVTVPVLYDKKERRIVNNESSEIIRMLNTQLNSLAKHPEVNLVPQSLEALINETNEWVYPMLNNGVYRAGFASTQEAYEEACQDVFQALDRMEAILSKQRHLCSNTELTEADVRAFTTLARFDAVYHTHFKCNMRRLSDYHNVYGYLRDLYQRPAFGETINFEHIKKHYYMSHENLNPKRIVPLGPILHLDDPHDRDRKFASTNEAK